MTETAFSRILGRETAYLPGQECWHSRFLVEMTDGSTTWVEMKTSFDPVKEEVEKSKLWAFLIEQVQRAIAEGLKELEDRRILKSNGSK